MEFWILDKIVDLIEGNDANHDGINDNKTVKDANGDGRIDQIIDANKDGLDDSYAIKPAANQDTDGDGKTDRVDVDDDNDSIPSVNEDVNKDGDYRDDTDADGKPNYLDKDDDGDGIDTKYEKPDPNADGDPQDAVDTDKDKTPDYLDPDDDGDGFPTKDESPDENKDGKPDDAKDTDKDGIPDYLDPTFLIDVEPKPNTINIGGEITFVGTVTKNPLAPLEDTLKKTLEGKMCKFTIKSPSGSTFTPESAYKDGKCEVTLNNTSNPGFSSVLGEGTVSVSINPTSSVKTWKVVAVPAPTPRTGGQTTIAITIASILVLAGGAGGSYYLIKKRNNLEVSDSNN
jgi:LPXTG-motif cell wall-anchored protein